VAFSPDGQQVLSGSADGTVQLWAVETETCLITLYGTPDGWVAFTPHGQYKFAGDLARRF
jgi:WD40 repeat protein